MLLAMAAMALLLTDFYFPGTFKNWYLVQRNGLQIDLTMMILFGLQHSLMARQSFKKVWTRLIPPELERPTYVLFSGLFLFWVVALWSPVFPPLYDLSGTLPGYLLLGMAGLGYVVLLWGAQATDALDLIGIRSIQRILRREAPPKEIAPLVTHGLYRYSRHPLYLGMVMIFWFTPAMTPDHFLFASVMTLYIQIGITFEEKDLHRVYGKAYAEYCAKTAPLIPFLKFRR